MTFDDILDRLAGRAFDHIAEGLGARVGIQFCPRDRIPMIRLPSGRYYCPSCEDSFTRDPPRSPPGMNGADEAFRPFDPFAPPRRTRRWGEGVPPRSGRAPGNPNRKRQAPEPPPEPPRLDVIAAAYKELELTPPVTKSDVKKRRRELAMTFHPDHGGDGKKLARINAAADLLLEVL